MDYIPRTKEEIAGTVEYICESGEPVHVAAAILKLRIAKHEVIAAVPYGTAVMIYYHKAAEYKRSDVYFNIHDLIGELKKLSTTQDGMARWHLDTLPSQAAISGAHLADELAPLSHAGHIIGAREMAAILLRAYYAGRTDGEAECQQGH